MSLGPTEGRNEHFDLSSVQYSQTPLFRGFWEEKFRPLKPRNRGDREIGRQLLFPLMTQTTNLNGNRGHDTALLHYRTSQYAFIYSLKLF